MLEPYIEIIDRFGRRRRARRGEVPADGETVHFSPVFMDADARAARAALDERFGNHTIGDDDMLTDQRPRGYVRGYAFADAPIVARNLEDAATRAYEARSARMQNAWRRKDTAQADTHDAAPLRTRTLDELHAASAAAYTERSKRMAEAWKNRHD
jgi:hypothetical protein